MPNNVGLKQKVDAYKRANVNLQNLGLPTSDDGQQLCFSWHLIVKCNLKCKSHYDQSSNNFRVDTLYRPPSSNELQQLLAWKQIYTLIIR